MGLGWNSMYLSKHYVAFEIRGLRGRVGKSFDISGTASVDNSYGPDLWFQLKLCAKFSIFLFFLILLGQFLPHTGASFHPIKPLLSISMFPFLSLLWHVWANKLSTGTSSWHLSLSTGFTGCCLGVHLDWQRSSMTMMSPLLSWRTPAWIETSEEMSGDPPRRQAQKVIIGDSKGN